ncbi:MAG TPA: FecR family protein [Candidatus Limnocylindria bacterium]|nr:FecR family protein [Candidatus Limnocylindria bacterium]
MGKGWDRRRFVIAALVAALVVVPAVLVLTQQRAASAATILRVLDGSASVARGTAAFVVAADGDIVSVGDRVQTGDRSHAIVTFFDGSTLEIEPATTVQIEESSSTGAGAISIRIAQTIGRTWASVRKLTRADSKFEIRTPALTAGVRGTGFITEVLADGATTVQTTDGTVQVTAQGQTVLVGAGQSTTAQPNGAPTVPASSASPPNLLRFGMHSPAYLAVVDPFGRACGVVLPGPTVVRQIPGCLASGPGADPQLVDVPNAPAGTYQVVIESIAPGGAFTATASAVDGLGNLSFNYLANGIGQPGATLASRIDVEAVANGALSSIGFGPLLVIAQTPVKVVAGSHPQGPSNSDTGLLSSFSPLPGIGFGAGTNTTPLPLTSASSVLPMSSLIPSGVVIPGGPSTPDPTAIAIQSPTPIPTLPAPPIQTVAPTLASTPIPTLAPTPTPTPQPTPTPRPPTLTGGTAAPGGFLSVLGESWPVGAAVTIAWPDGSQIGSADVNTSGQFATRIRVPASAIPGSTYKITASGGGLVATADVVVALGYVPTFTLLNTFAPRAGGSVGYTGDGWPPNSSYSIYFDGGSAPVGGGVTSTGTFQGSFTVPANTKAGQHTVTATSAGYSVNAPLITQ